MLRGNDARHGSGRWQRAAPAVAPLASGKPWTNLGLLTIRDPTILRRGHLRALLCAGFVAGISSFRGEGTMLSSGATSKNLFGQHLLMSCSESLLIFYLVLVFISV